MPVEVRGTHICGRAYTVRSQIIIDNTNTTGQITTDDRGSFLLDGMVFCAYRFDDAVGIIAFYSNRMFQGRGRPDGKTRGTTNLYFCKSEHIKGV